MISLGPVKRWADPLAIAVVFMTAMAFSGRLGVAFSWNSLDFFWQYLDRDLLRTDLLRSLWNLHSQPPLYNLYLGLCLKLGGSDPAPVFQATSWITGFLLLYAMHDTMRTLGLHRRWSLAVTAVFAIQPAFMVYTNWLFYTLPVALMLAAAGWALARYVRFGGTAWAHGFWWACAGVCLTRATFQWAWMVLAGLVLTALLSRMGRATKGFVIAGVLPLLLVNAWCLRNYTQVGVYGTSSWYGMNLARGWSLDPAAAETLRERAGVDGVWFLGPFRRAEDYMPYGYFHPYSQQGLHPADGNPRKANGEPNYNHREYARLSKDMLRGDLAAMRTFPDRYAARVGDAYLMFTQPGPNSTHFLVRYGFGRVKAWKDTVTRVLFMGGTYMGYGGGKLTGNLLSLTYPFIVLLLLIAPFRLAKKGDGERGIAVEALVCMAFAGITAIWGMACSVLVEIGENDRMRWETDALVIPAVLALAAFWAVFAHKPGVRRDTTAS